MQHNGICANENWYKSIATASKKYHLLSSQSPNNILKIFSVIYSQTPKPIKMKAVCVALFALFAVASAGYLSAPAVVAAPVLRAAPVAVAAVPAYRAAPVLAAGPIAYGAAPLAYGGLGGVATYGGLGGLAYGGPLIG